MVTFVNRFSVTGPAEEFERLFEQTSAFFVAQPGFVAHRLMRHADQAGSYVNVAEWQDAESFRRAVTHPDFAPHAAALRALSTSDPQLFTTTVLERRSS
ncbi:antibiotic biosynthesis monooxygenase family protein [Streptomyces sp. NPDC050145]|uniref:antibiotic biosynthesis monooxygenase family protein n=1 Tax=Streptomyces sp. NPDC050145 TaxID=3365602 RepID=UPI0037A38B62